jgi:hypothetical protein
MFYLKQLENEDPLYLEKFSTIDKLINPYSFIYSIIPNYNICISKLNKSNLFYVFFELFFICDITSYTSFLHFSEDIDTEPIIDSVKTIQGNNESTHICKTIVDKDNTMVDLITCNISFTMVSLIKLLLNLRTNGHAIIKINHTFNKSTIDILYFLNNIFKKVYIIKPHILDIMSDDKYIICKNFTSNFDFLNSLIDQQFSFNEIPCIFLNKLEEINIIIYSQKIKYIDQINHFINIKNSQEKIDNIIKYNIQKCINLCEYYKIPNNKIIEKTNLFLHSNS